MYCKYDEPFPSRCLKARRALCERVMWSRIKHSDLRSERERDSTVLCRMVLARFTCP